MKAKTFEKKVKLLDAAPGFRWTPDPHRRHNVVQNKKHYSRKARTRSGSYDFLAA